MPSHSRIFNFRLSESVQHVISIAAIAIISFVGLETLVYINNLYEIRIFIMTSGFIYLFLIIWLYFIFDLHFKGRFWDAETLWHALKWRFAHFTNWEHFRHFQNYMILPGIIYWGSVILIGINFRHHKLQQFIAVVSSVALIFAYTFFKEIFKNKQTPVENKHFIILSYIKLYAAWLAYSSALGIVWYYCLAPHIFYLAVFLFTLMLLWQAAFQFTVLNMRVLFFILGISIFIAVGSVFVFNLWNVNYFSAGLFMTAFYNLLWGMMFHTFKKSLNAEVVIEQVLIFVLIVVMVLGVTNFHARIDRCGF